MTGISFIHPYLLLGLFAISIPIIIHLIHRKKAIRWSFAAMEFLLRSHRHVARRFKIKQLLLLLLRSLIIAAIVLSFAKPFIKRTQNHSPSMPNAIVFIIDDSFSMQYKESPHSKTLFEIAKKKIHSILSHLRGEDQVALIHGSASQKPVPFEQVELTFDKQTIVRKLKHWKASFRTTDLEDAFNRASFILKNKKGFKPKLIVLSDFARHTFQSSKVPSMLGLPPIEIIPIRPSHNNKEPYNLAITNIETNPAPFASSDAYRFIITIKNFSKRTVPNLLIKLHLNGRAKAQGSLSIAPYSTTQKQFIIQLKRAGLYFGYAEIQKDPLMGDNRFYFTLKAKQQPKILLINGDPRTTPYLDELYYLERALRDTASPFSIKTQLISSNLLAPSQFNVIFLANVPQLPQSWIVQLEKFVQDGGGLFISSGEQINPLYYNQHFASLLPRQLRHKALAAQRPDGTGVAIQRYFGEIQGTHPIFRTLYRNGIIFQTARISKLMLVQTRQKNEMGQLLWRYSHGPPALLERSIKKGRVLFLTTTIDRDWTDLPIRSFFQPWIQNTISYLAGGSHFQAGKSLYIDQNSTIILKGELPIKVSAPQKTSFWLRSTGSFYPFRGGSFPGLYRFYRDGKPLKILPKAVNIDPKESNTKLIPLQKLKKIGSLTLQNTNFQHSSRLWQFVLLFLCLFFFSETIIMRFM